jgi:hypothetical protein
MTILNQRGNVLLFVISGIAMVAAIAMGMFYMTSTSSLGQAGGSGMNRAYYLALAGKDYALANWSNMASWNGIEFSLSNTETFQVSYLNEKITSTGIVNKDTPFEAKKIITAQSPSPVRKHLLESFEDLTKWATGAQVGGHATPAVSGDKALSVTSYASAFGSGRWSFLQLKTGIGVDSAVDFSPAWKDAGYCLSHDLQVKIANSQPYYMAGINFKVAGSGDSREFYGISFLRARQTEICIPGCFWIHSDNIPLGLKPAAIWTSPVTIGSYKYSQPAIVLWKRQGGTFTWLAYKLLASTDYVVDASNYLINWSNLQIRLNEAYPLEFTNGGPSPLLHGAIVVGATSGAIARISETPIMTSETWSGNTASGTLTLTTVSGTFQNGENLLVNGVIRARVSGAIGAKTNYIRAYYGDESSHGTQNSIPTDSDNRGGNPRIVTGSGNVIHWPVDNISDWSAFYDYMTIVQWDGFQASASRLGGSGTGEANAIIGDSSLLTPNSGAINYSGIALHATGNTAVSTYFDDFAIQY